MDTRSLIRKIPDYPSPGITYYDLSTLITGAVSEAAAMLIKDVGGKVVECCFVHELAAVGGRKRLEKHGRDVFTLWEN